jgi:hypothetical protein
MKRGRAPFRVERSGYHLLLDAVPAWLCSNRAEAFFEEAQANAIQDVVLLLDTKIEAITTPPKGKKRS